MGVYGIKKWGLSVSYLWGQIKDRLLLEAVEDFALR